MRILTILLCLAFSLQINAQHSIIPEPVSFEQSEGVFQTDANLNFILVNADAATKATVDRFRNAMQSKGFTITKSEGPWNTGAQGKKVGSYEKKKDKDGGHSIEIGKAPSIASKVSSASGVERKAIYFGLNEKEVVALGDEGYSLEVKPNRIDVKANKAAGILYGIESLKQLFPMAYYNYTAKNNEGLEISSCKITDYPRFGWRGLMFDVSRHFFTVEEVKTFIDIMPEYKLNTFHWHLVDDNGWRIEIKSLPKLTEVGAWRVERFGTFGQRADPKPGEPTTYGGFYTQEQIRDVIQYAADRNISIVPEIDVPGHSMAMLAAYPELSCKQEQKMVNPGTEFAEWFADHTFKMLIENTLDPSNEKVYETLDKIFGEIAQLFPGEYIHMGGDECYHGYWEEDPDCQALMKKEGITTGLELQSYFVTRVGKIINKHGKKMIGWDEILDGELDKNSAIMSWRGVSGGKKAAAAGYNVVMSPTTHVYLDYSQSDHSLEIPIYNDLRLNKTYSFDPVPEGVNAKYILGAQGNLWTEQIPTLDHALYMTYPRAMAIAEFSWSPKEKKNWMGFVNKLDSHFEMFDKKNRNVCRAVYDPIVHQKMKGEQVMVDFTSEIEGVDFYYTIDHTFPSHRSNKYTGTFEVPAGQNVGMKVVAYRNGKQIGRMISLHRDKLIERAKKGGPVGFEEE